MIFGLRSGQDWRSDARIAFWRTAFMSSAFFCVRTVLRTSAVICY